jgi:hypothetical protein
MDPNKKTKRQHSNGRAAMHMENDSELIITIPSEKSDSFLPV